MLSIGHPILRQRVTVEEGYLEAAILDRGHNDKGFSGFTLSAYSFQRLL